jgi:hypothetical protein
MSYGRGGNRVTGGVRKADILMGPLPSKRSHVSEAPIPARQDKDLRRVLAGETLVGILFDAGVFPYVIWLVNLTPPATLGGPDGVVASLTKATIFAVSLMTIILTVVWRRNVANGTAPRVGAKVFAWSSVVPRNILVRVIFFVLLAMVTLMPVGIAICVLFGLYPMTKLSFAAFNVGYGMLIGTVVTPYVTLAAMAGFQKGASMPGNEKSQVESSEK